MSTLLFTSVTGTDERAEIMSARVSEQQRARARGVVSVFFNAVVPPSLGNPFTPTSRYTHGEVGHVRMPLCSGEQFVGQPAGAIQSGVLIAPDIVATARHGLPPNDEEINAVWFVFDYQIKIASVPATIWRENMYRGKSIIADDPASPDWALVQLDRNVTEADRVQLRASSLSLLGRHVYTIGHPYGLPVKFGGTAKIGQVDVVRGSFKAGLDASRGNSGSPVFDAESHAVVGLVISDKTPDFVGAGSCCKENFVPLNATEGDECVMVSRFASFIP